MKQHFILAFLHLLLSASAYAQVEVFEDEQSLLQGLKDKATGKVIMEPGYSEINEFYEGVASVQSNWGWGYIDSTGKQLVAPEYTSAANFKNGRGLLTKDSLNFLVTKLGELTQLGAGRVFNLNKSGYYKISKGLRSGIVDSTGKLFLPIEYHSIREINNGSCFIISKNRTYGFVNLADKIIIPAIYEKMHADRNLIRICKDKKWGYMDSTGKMILPLLLYKAALYCGDSVFAVLDGSGYSLITNAGKEVSPSRYGYIAPYSGNKMIAETMKGRYGVIDNKDNKIIPFKYTGIVAEGGLLRLARERE